MLLRLRKSGVGVFSRVVFTPGKKADIVKKCFYIYEFTFTFMYLADAFIQSLYKCTCKGITIAINNVILVNVIFFLENVTFCVDSHAQLIPEGKHAGHNLCRNRLDPALPEFDHASILMTSHASEQRKNIYLMYVSFQIL